MKTANRIIMAVTGLVLVISAWLKVHQLLSEPIITTSFWESRLFFIIQIPLEMGLGIWLLCGIFKKIAWIIAEIAFAGFIAVTAYKAVTGIESCGCFGSVSVNPWLTLLAIDVPIFILMLIFRPTDEKLFTPHLPSLYHLIGTAVPTFMLLGFITTTLIIFEPPEKTDDYEVLKPKQWQKPTKIHPHADPNHITAITGQNQTEKTIAANHNNSTGKPNSHPDKNTGAEAAKKWPLLEHINIADSLKSGIAVVFFHHFDCPDCSQAIPEYDRMARSMIQNKDAIKFAFIEAPPYGPPEKNLIPENTPALTGKLDDTKKWLFTTPLVVVTVDGCVIKTWEVDTPDLDTILNTVFAK